MMDQRNEISTPDNPYTYSQQAKERELAGDFRQAEELYWQSIQAADKLPLDQYREHFVSKQAHSAIMHHASEVYDGKTPLVNNLDQVDRAYQELLALPFLMRVQLAGFYARHEALPEAHRLLQQAFNIEMPDAGPDNPDLHAMQIRARDLMRDIENIIGPADVEPVFLKIFDKLDVDKDGFVNEAELKRAQLDLSIDAHGQQVIRYLLYHYFKVEQASNDEFGMDISGVSKADVHNFQKEANQRWKRMGKKKK
jgi:hypothetical protein